MDRGNNFYLDILIPVRTINDVVDVIRQAAMGCKAPFTIFPVSRDLKEEKTNASKY